MLPVMTPDAVLGQLEGLRALVRGDADDLLQDTAIAVLGTFELTGIPAGPLSIMIGAGGYHPRIEAAMTAVDGATLGPSTIALTRLADGEQPSLELVGVGMVLSADAESLRVERVIAGSGAEAAGIVAGDHVIAVDGISVMPLGVDGAIAKIRGVEGTTVSITLQRGAAAVPLVVQRRKLRA